MNHDEAIELAGLYVLGALSPDERAQVEAHLASCPEGHDEFAQVGALTPALASLADPVSAPASLKDRVMADYRAGVEAAARPPATMERKPAPVIELRSAPRSWLGWAVAAAAVLLLAVTAGWAYIAQSNAAIEQQRAQTIARAIDVMAAPGSSVAILSGSATAAGASGFAAFGADGAGYIVLVDMPVAPSGKTYQAWYIADGVPDSAGLLSVDRDGYAILELAGRPGTQVIALTVEPTGGSVQPTSDPIAAGELRPNPAAS
jgi:anti-sigma-K factor RskA